MRYLGIDFGSKRVGLAVSDEDGKIAFPYKIIQNTKSLLTDIQLILDKEKIDEIVIGKSVDSKGEDNKIMELIYDFIGEISLTTAIPTHFEAEDFSTFEVRRMTEGKLDRRDESPRKKVASNDRMDDKAATLLLQRFLDRVRVI